MGGWGGHLGDEGSGFGIGMSALRALVRAEDGRGVPTVLRDSLLQAIGLAGPADLIKWAASARKADVASLIPLICGAAEEGDEAATAVLEDAVGELVQHVGTVIRRLEPWPATPEVALAGGLIQPDGPLRLRLIRALEEVPCRTLDRLPDGTRGACSLAMGLADQTEVSPES